jgi:hypothetical protein
MTKALLTAQQIENNKVEAGKYFTHYTPEQRERFRKKRIAMADAEFERYNFGEDISLVSAEGWEYSEPGDTMKRNVYLAHRDTANPDADSFTEVFTISFMDENSLGVLSVGCY